MVIGTATTGNMDTVPDLIPTISDPPTQAQVQVLDNMIQLLMLCMNRSLTESHLCGGRGRGAKILRLARRGGVIGGLSGGFILAKPPAAN